MLMIMYMYMYKYRARVRLCEMKGESMPDWTDIEYVYQFNCVDGERSQCVGPGTRPERIIWYAFYNSGPVYWSFPSTSAVSPGERIDPDQAHDLAERWAALRRRYQYATGNTRHSPGDPVLEFLKGR